ncbi:MAG: hypothetical protein WCK29_00600 [archaeon]
MNKKVIILLCVLVGLVLIYAVLYFLPIKYPYCGGSTWSGGVPTCDCIGIKKGPFLWGVDQCVGLRTKCYALSDMAPLSQTDLKNDKNTPISEVESFLKSKYSGFPNKTGEFKIERVNEKDEYISQSCSNGTCVNNTITHNYFFKFNIGVDCKYYDENIANNWDNINKSAR